MVSSFLDWYTFYKAWGRQFFNFSVMSLLTSKKREGLSRTLART